MRITVLALLLAASAPAAEPSTSRTSGKITQSVVKLDAKKKMAEGRLTLRDEAGHIEEFRVLPGTKIRLDGKPAKFEKSAAAGVLATAVVYDPQTKIVSSLELKSDSDDPKGAETVTGEVASTDALRGAISVRTAPKTNRDFAVGEATKILREQDGKKTEIGLEAVSVGDAVEVHLRDGKTVEIHARPAAR